MHLALRRFEFYNDDENCQQVIIALFEEISKESHRFYNSAMIKRPQLAKVDKVQL
jgi:hypothetical protein